MIIEQIGIGSTIIEASENGKALLAAPEEVEIHQEVIQDAKKKLFGLISEPAKVKVWYEIADKPKKAEAPAKSAPVKEKKAQEVKSSPKAHTEKPAPVKEKAPAKEENKSAPAKSAETKTEKAASNKVEEAISENDAAAKYLRMIIDGIGIKEYSLTLTKNTDTNEYTYTVECDDDGALIGRRGETLDSIQYLLRLSINKGLDDDKHRKISVNIGNYREKRNDNLRALAHRSAKQVLKYGRNVVLDPMNPYERRIVHTAIQEIEGVTSHSIGQDAGRKVIISLEEGVQPTHPSKGGYNRGGRNDRRRGGKGGYQKKEAYQPETTRAPRKDSAGSLYGKIEIPAKKTEE